MFVQRLDHVQLAMPPGGELKVHLGVASDFRPARRAHVALIAADLVTLVARLRSAGFAVKGDESLEGYHRTYLGDPFGNRIEFMEPVSA